MAEIVDTQSRDQDTRAAELQPEGRHDSSTQEKQVRENHRGRLIRFEDTVDVYDSRQRQGDLRQKVQRDMAMVRCHGCESMAACSNCASPTNKLCVVTYGANHEVLRSNQRPECGS